jgi:hypothetical protein
VSAVQTVRPSSVTRYAAESTGRECSLTTWRLVGADLVSSGDKSQRRNDLSDEVDTMMGGVVGNTVVDLTKSV